MCPINGHQHHHHQHDGHDHNHEHGVVARWLGRMHHRVAARRESGGEDRLSRLQEFGLKAAAVTIRCAAFVMCPGDDIAAAALPVAHAWTGDSDQGHHEESAILPRKTVIVAELPRDGDGPDPDPSTDPELPVPPSDPAAYDVSTMYQRFVLAGVAEPTASGPATGRLGPAGPAADRGNRPGPDVAR